MTAPNDLNFLPDDYVAARRRARANYLCGSLLAIVVVGVAAAFGYAEHSLRQLRHQHAEISEQFRQESDRFRRLDALQKQQDALARRAALAEALVEKAPRAELLSALRDALPRGASLAEVTLTSRVREAVRTPEQVLADRQAARNSNAPPPEPQPKRYDVALHVAGLAYTDVQVAEFIGTLARSRYFDDVNLFGIREFAFDGQLVRRFELDVAVRPEPLPAHDDATAPIVSTEALLRP